MDNLLVQTLLIFTSLIYGLFFIAYVVDYRSFSDDSVFKKIIKANIILISDLLQLIKLRYKNEKSVLQTLSETTILFLTLIGIHIILITHNIQITKETSYLFLIVYTLNILVAWLYLSVKSEQNVMEHIFINIIIFAAFITMLFIISTNFELLTLKLEDLFLAVELIMSMAMTYRLALLFKREMGDTFSKILFLCWLLNLSLLNWLFFVGRMNFFAFANNLLVSFVAPMGMVVLFYFSRRQISISSSVKEVYLLDKLITPLILIVVLRIGFWF